MFRTVPEGLFPGILKTARNGYDGKGQVHVPRAGALADAWHTLGGMPCILEKRLSWQAELSVILARGRDGSMKTYPLAENTHRNGVLETSRVPAEVPAAVATKAAGAAALIAEALDYVGVLAVEFFLVGDALLVNEFALRPHNSGHYTIDACGTSQFEQQVRALAGLPLGPTDLRCPAAMVNVLGDVWHRGEPQLGDLAHAFGAQLHMYGKAEPRAGRKMGHFTILDGDATRALRRAEHLRRALRGRRAEGRQP